MSEETVSTLREDYDPGLHDHYGLTADESTIDYDNMHATRDVAAGLYVQICDSCSRYAEAAQNEIRIYDRTLSGEFRRCAHVWTPCTHRDADGLRAAEFMEHCDDCDQWFCVEHSHRRPTSINEQRCASCDSFQPRCVDLDYCESCDERYCEGHDHLSYCEGSDDYDEGWDPGYSDAGLTFEDEGDHPLATGKRFAAVEIEAEYGSRIDLPYPFGMCSDGSLSNGGLEVTTPPARGSALVGRLREAMREMIGAGWDVGSDACSMHTHIDLRDKQEDKVFQSRLFATFYAIEDVLFSMQANDRTGTGYADPLRKHWEFYAAYGKWAPDFDFVYNKLDKTLSNEERIKSLRHTKEGNRYIGFNFQSLAYRGTLECRIHEGCLDWEVAAKWIELLQFIIARVERGVTYPQLRKLLEMPVGEDKILAMAKYFSLPDVITDSIRSRIAYGSTFYQTYEIGTPHKGRNKQIELGDGGDEATAFLCEGCARFVNLADPRNMLGPLGHRTYCERINFDPTTDQLARMDYGYGTYTALGLARDLSAARRRTPLRDQARRLITELDEIASGSDYLAPGTRIEWVTANTNTVDEVAF